MKRVKGLVVAVHDGYFHADEVFAVAILKKLYQGIKVIRTRDMSRLEKVDIRVDVGFNYDLKKNDFDHHQKGFSLKRSNGIPYASCGLVWKSFGMRIARSKNIFEYIDKRLIEPVDADDNGIKTYKNINDWPVYTTSMAIDSYNLQLGEKDIQFTQFRKAVHLAGEVLDRELVKAKAAAISITSVNRAMKRSKGGYIILSKGRLLWKDILAGSDTIKFVISPSGHRWSSVSVPEKRGGFATKNLFPKEWRGLQEELESATSISGAIFCHRNGFIAVAKTRKAIIELTERAITQNENEKNRKNM